MIDPMVHAGVFARLAQAFFQEDVRFREGRNGGYYVKAPTVMNRLDSVLGPDGWWDHYTIIDEITVECALSIRLPDGQVVTKKDVGIRKPAEAGRIDPGCSWKAAYSDALKRAAAKFGVARYLSKCGYAEFVGVTLQALENPTPTPDPGPEPGSGSGEPATAAATPASSAGLPSQARAPVTEVSKRMGESRGSGETSAVPRTGGQLYRWARDFDDRENVGLVDYLQRWAKLREYPRMMKDWSEHQVAAALDEVNRRRHSDRAVAS